MSQLSLPLEAGFINREMEMDILHTLLRQTRTGKGCVVFVAGEAGVGKTRLVKEFGQHAESDGSVFLEGSSYEQEGIVPYSPWTDILRTLLKRVPADNLRKLQGWMVTEIGRLVPAIISQAEELGLTSWLRGPRAPSMIMPSADQERVRFFQAVTDLLATAARERPIIMFLDDLGWADPASLQLFQYVARRVSESKLMLVAAYRDVELPDSHPLLKIMLDLNRQRIARQVSLTRFSQEHVSRLLTSHMKAPVSKDFTQLVFTRTGGNPFFVEEFVRSLLDGGLVQRKDDAWSLGDLKGIEIPTSVRAIIRQRTIRLGEHCVNLLSIASLIGMEFDFEVLKRVAMYPEESSLSLLETALKAQLIRERREGSAVLYAFVDEQIRDFLGDQVSILRSRKYHISLGHALEETYKDTIQDHLGEIAYHFVQGADVAKAREYSVRAGDRFFELHAHVDAMKHFANALELTGEGELEARLDLLTRLGRTAYVRGSHEDVLRFCGQAVEAAKKLGLTTRLADLHALIGSSYFFNGSSKYALENCFLGLQALEGKEDSAQKAFLCQLIGRVYVIGAGDQEKGQTCVKKAVEIATKLDAHEVLAHAYQTLAVTLAVRDKELILEYLEKALQIAIEHNLEEVTLRAYINLASTYSSLKGDYGRAKDLLLKGIDYARSSGYLDSEVWMRGSLLSDARLYLGEWETCEKEAPGVISLAKELGEKNLWAPSYVTVFIAIARGDLQKARKILDGAFSPDLWPELMAGYHLLAAKIEAAQDKLDDADRDLQAALNYGNKNSWSLALLDSFFEMIKLNLKKGNLDRAYAYYADLQLKTSEFEEKWADAIERWAKGLIADSRDDIESGMEALEECVNLWRLVRRPYDLAQALKDLSRLQTKAGHKRQAEDNIEEARKIFRQLGIANGS